ncbi:MAG: ADP-heptose--LPS heptosyltransferase [Ignavibacteriales bacterium CG12_big_fil_rev_8_21_14_0_65_30_8]|nr:MAG: ADP-heptose--LPS heptosyltransferase [Ignavibacteriales bacterium CG12_big_fil_rev_8_21_14_0_65_30_8]
MIKPKNLLIIRTDRIGDVVLTVPLAELIKKYYPDCKITFLVRKYTKEILYNHPFIDETIIAKTKGNKLTFFENYKILKNKNFDTVVVVSPSFIISLIIFLSNTENRIGTGYRWYSFLFNKKVFVHRKFAEKHELEFNVELLKEIGIDEIINSSNVKYSLQVNTNNKEKIENLLRVNNILLSKPIFIIHPGSGGSSVDLPANKFKELIQKILTDFDVNIIITGSKEEKIICQNLVVNDSIFNFTGKLSLSELIYLINECKLFISNSTGPLHIAAALNKNVVGFYPNLLACSYKRWGPFGSKTKVFIPQNECKNCKLEQCSSEECMNNIDIDDVINYIKNIEKT